MENKQSKLKNEQNELENKQNKLKNEQSKLEISLYRQLQNYGDSDFYPYHMPGHKRRLYGSMPEELLKIDITEIDGFDNLHQAEGIIKEAQERAARLYGAEESFYLVNGSTCGILSAISAALPNGGHILMARNSHKSAYHAAYLKNLTISYLYPPYLREYDIFGAINPKEVKKALEENPDIGAVFLVSPTYEGRIADIKKIAEVVHAKGIPLIVDEAHGAHLGLAENFPLNSCRLGADIVIHSVHKTLPAMTQTALLHINGTLVNRSRVRRYLHIYQTSSPSYVLMAGIDNALRIVEERGAQLFKQFRENYLELLACLEGCKHLKFVPFKEKEQDIGKLVISSNNKGLSGQQIYDMLLTDYHLQLEMAAGGYCLAMFTIGDGIEAYQRLAQALLAIDKKIDACMEIVQEEAVWDGVGKAAEMDNQKGNNFKAAIPLAQAWDMATEAVPLEKAVGRYVADFINLYPPGVPLLVPGEVLDQGLYEQVRLYREQGLSVQGIEENAPYNIKVLK